jgi:exonuclease SbcC
MRLQRLVMTAIGPFADRVELDLARFGDTGVFLIEGKTGAGKSTVLDAISFALYGKLAQSSGVVERLKSHHAPEDAEPVVELVFETQSGRYRIRRTPTHTRPKKRGTGSVAVNMTAKLFRLTDADDLDGGELISHNLGDVEDEITRAVGLSHAQFVQTVLLPQGEFARFLHASTKDRRALLQRLFGTEVLVRTQQLLEDGRGQALRERSQAAEAVRNAVHAFAGAAGLGEDDVAEVIELAESAERSALTGRLQAAEGALRAAVDESGAALSSASAARTLAAAALQTETDLDRRRNLRSLLRAERDQLAHAAPAQELARAEHAAAQRALAVQPAAQGLHSAIALLDAARQAELTARAALPAELAELDEVRLRAAGADQLQLLGTLSGELDRERTLAGRRTELAGQLASSAEQGRLLATAERLLRELPDQEQQLRARLQACEAAAGQLTALRAEHERAAARLQAARQAEEAAREATRDRQLARELFEAAATAQQRFATLQTQWRAGIASELGLALQAGDPCAVCGSVEHPRPARPAAGHISQEQLRSAEGELTRLNTQVEQRHRQLTERQAILMQLQLAAEQLTPELARATLDKVEAALGDAEQAAGRLSGLQAELAALTGQHQQLSEHVRLVRAEQARAAQRAESLHEDIERDEQLLAAARGGHASVAERVAALRQLAAAIEDAVQTAIATGRALTAAQSAGSFFTAALAEAGFADEQAWQDARRPDAVIEALSRQVKDYDNRVKSVDTRLGTAELTDPALDGEHLDLAGLALVAVQAESAEQSAAQAHGAAQDRLAKAAALAARVERAIRGGAATVARTAAAIRVGNLASGLGENRLKMELTSYVLVRRFAEVLAAANTQLLRVSQGRYQLEHTDARTGAAKSGLNMRVLDLHTGRPRDPATLSGGETFYVSLALALGLADVVRAESGGIDLGTLFIDEGFGTLDAEVLDEVIEVLDSLRAGGRAVGIVSHVTELKMRIADRIKVERNLDGTSRLTTTG